jgi:hypothetical protein
VATGLCPFKWEWRGAEEWAVWSEQFKLFQSSNGLKTFKFFQILIDPNLTFSSSKNLK